MKIQVHCPEHGWQDTPKSKEIEGIIIESLDLGKQIHADLAQLAKDTDHQELKALLDKNCSGNHSHGHACDHHELGHHHETIKISGKNHHLCDPASLRTLLTNVRSALGNCPEKTHDHSALETLLEVTERKIDRLEEISGCTRKFCLECLLADTKNPLPRMKFAARAR